MKAECPNCGTVFDVRKRAKGTGRSVNPRKPLGMNEREIYRLVEKDGNWLTIRGIQALLVEKKIPHRGRRGRGWNYNIVQGPVADLLGRGLFESQPVPGSSELRYRAKPRALEIIEEVRAATKALEELDLDKPAPAMTPDEALQAAFQR